jgi:hypothetical protein
VSGVLAACIAAALLLATDNTGLRASGVPVGLSARLEAASRLEADSSAVSQRLLQVGNKLNGPDKELDSDVDQAASGLEHWLFTRALRRPSKATTPRHAGHVAHTHNGHNVKRRSSDGSEREGLQSRSHSSLDSQASSVLDWFGISSRSEHTPWSLGTRRKQESVEETGEHRIGDRQKTRVTSCHKILTSLEHVQASTAAAARARCLEP